VRTACNVLRSFVNEARGERGHGLSIDLADVLIERATRLRAVLACD
jgi:hypothetical protein